MKEVPLPGGRTSPGVVLLGRTVRRPPGIASEFVRSLLLHLEAVGFDAAPRVLGTDDDGRDILGYVEGQVPPDLGWYDDEALIASAKLIRAYHDATVPLIDTTAAKSIGLEVICHNDLSPCNFVFRSDLPIAIIDFESASPGTRNYDLGYAAWLWLDIGNPDIMAIEQRRRLKVFVEAYGNDWSNGSVIEAIMLRQRVLITEGQRRGKDDMVRWGTSCLEWTSAHLK